MPYEIRTEEDLSGIGDVPHVLSVDDLQALDVPAPFMLVESIVPAASATLTVGQVAENIGGYELAGVAENIDLLTQSFSDYGNGQRIIALYGSDMRYSHTFRTWLLWKGTHWQIDISDAAVKLAHRTMLAFAQQALTAKNEAASRFAGTCLNSQRISSALHSAQPYLAVAVESLDTHPDLLNFVNGTVDLRAGQVRAPRREDLLTKFVPYEYDPDATCPRWHKFIDRILPGLKDYLQTALGYSLTGVTSEKAIFMCQGAGDNGKTTLLSGFRELLGDYATLIQIESLTAKQLDNNAQSDLADLHRKRFVMTSETRQDQRLDEAKLKRICQGMGTIRAVRKYQNPFEFPETHKLWIDSNFRPAINGSDNAIWNRLHSIPFKITIPPAEIDQELRAKLLAESEGILAWAVAGAVRWYRDRLQKPEAVTTATDEWRSDNDAISRFISECCVIGSLYQIKASPLYRRYVGWMQEIGERPTSQRAFGQEISQKYPRKSSNGVWYVGLGLQSAEE